MKMKKIDDYHGREYVLERKGSNIHYWINNDNHAGPIVVMSHGASLDHHMFDSQVEALKNAGYPTLTWDIRGHGLSKPIGDEFSLQIVLEDLYEIILRHKLEKVILVGHSFGGYLSQQFVFSYTERVLAIAVIGCTDITEIPSLGMGIAYRSLPFIFSLIPDGKLREQFAAGMGVTKAVQEYALDATQKLSRKEFINVMGSGVKPIYEDVGYGEGYYIPKPFLLTHGENDSAERGTFVKKAPIWALREHNCQYEVIPSAGHNANQDNPEYFNNIILGFIDQVTKNL